MVCIRGLGFTSAFLFHVACAISQLGQVHEQYWQQHVEDLLSAAHPGFL
jgi:Na+-transporting methylmalonyl-CoA/oxaloacetate decarboxylase gamma subunit